MNTNEGRHSESEGPHAKNIDNESPVHIEEGIHSLALNERAAEFHAHVTQGHQDYRDVVKNPKHYKILPGVELIDIRESLLDKIEDADILDARQLDCWSRSWEYLTRFAEKGGRQDLEKAYQYLHRLLHGEWPK